MGRTHVRNGDAVADRGVADRFPGVDVLQQRLLVTDDPVGGKDLD